MRKITTMTIIMFLTFSLTSPAHAANFGAKLGTGIKAIATSPLEFFKTTREVTEESGIIPGMTWGVLNGVVKFTGKAVVGAYQVVTFPVNIPGETRSVQTRKWTVTTSVDGDDISKGAGR